MRGGTTGSAFVPSPTQPTQSTSALSISVQAPTGVLPQLLRVGGTQTPAAHRRALQSISFQSLQYSAMLYSSYVSSVPIVAVSTVNATSLPSAYTFTLSGAPGGANQWVIVQVTAFTGQNGSGSSQPLGQVGGLVNITSTSQSVSLDSGSTERLQLAISAMANGLISTWDLRNETALDGDLGGQFGSTQPSPSTGLLAPSSIVSLLNTLYSIYNRGLAMTSNVSTSALFSIVVDYRDPNELNYIANVATTVGTLLSGTVVTPGSGLVGFKVIGNPFLGSSAASAVSKPGSGGNASLVNANAQMFPAPGASLSLQHVYGGGLIVGISMRQGTTIAPPPFFGALQGVGERGIGSTYSPAQFGVIHSTIVVTVNDPQTAAFLGTSAPFSNAAYTLGPSASTFSLDCSALSTGQCWAQNNVVVTAVNGSNITVALDGYNPWAQGTATGSMQLCTGLDCFIVPVSFSDTVPQATFNARAPFYDAGSNLSYYNWAPSSGNGVPGAGGVTGVSNASGGYAIAMSGLPYGWIQSNRSAYFYPGQKVSITTTAPAGTTWYLNLQCPSGNVSASGVEQTYGNASIPLTTLTSIQLCTGMEIGIGLPTGAALPTSLTIGPIGTAPAPSTGTPTGGSFNFTL